MAISSNADFYLNFQQFSDLKLQAREQSQDAALAVAQQFEGLFMQQMLTAMRSASKIDSQEHSSYVDFYREMHDKQLAQSMAKQGSLGVARLIMQNLPGADSSGVEPAAPMVLNQQAALAAISQTGPAPMVLPARVAAVAATSAPASATIKPLTGAVQADAAAVKAQAVVTQAGAEVVLKKVVDDDFAEIAAIARIDSRWQQAETFVADIWPGAQLAAAELGVSAELLVAQSALETGWGRHSMKLDDGRNSYNLFGIKADAGWDGAVVNRASLEFRDGLLQSEVSSFRAYASPAASLADYVDFIRSNPRYRSALEVAGDDRAYIDQIHQAGYATDPDYAGKVMGIVNGEVLQRSLASLDSGEIQHV